MKFVKYQTDQIRLEAVKDCGRALQYVKHQTEQICKMKEGQKFFRKINDRLTYETCWTFDDEYVKTVSRYRRLDNVFEMSHIDYIPHRDVLIVPFPNDIKHDYQVDDDVYVWLNSQLVKAVVTLVRLDRFHVKTYNHRHVVSFAKDLVPFNWWILHEKCRLALLEFCKCAKRVGIYRDVRNIIARFIWETRNDYIWECNHKHTHKRRCHKKIKNYEGSIKF